MACAGMCSACGDKFWSFFWHWSVNIWRMLLQCSALVYPWCGLSLTGREAPCRCCKVLHVAVTRLGSGKNTETLEI